MAEPHVAPYGSWKSPITSDLIVTATVGLGQIALDGADTYWVELRPSEGGRNCIVRRTPDGTVSDVTPQGFNARTRVPERAILLVGGLTLVAGLFFVGQIGLISALVNFGALFSFMLLHASVVSYYGVRRRSRNAFLHWVSPVIGFLVIGYVLWNADIAAKIGGVVWLVIGAGVLAYYNSRGTGVLAEHAADPAGAGAGHDTVPEERRP